jgi:hypothetical protein
MMVYHSENPCALKGYVKDLLPMHFNLNAKGWVASPHFMVYITSKLESELREHCEKEDLALQILLIDNVLGHLITIQDLCEHIKVVFIPVNA